MSYESVGTREMVWRDGAGQEAREREERYHGEVHEAPGVEDRGPGVAGRDGPADEAGGEPDGHGGGDDVRNFPRPPARQQPEDEVQDGGIERPGEEHPGLAVRQGKQLSR